MRGPVFAGAMALIAALLAGCGTSTVVGDAPAPPPSESLLSPQQLLAELRDGGEVIVFRHALTDREQADVDPQNPGSCEIQRNLSVEGVAQAEDIGRSLTALDIPVGDVLASPYCRTVDTAEAAFGSATETRDLITLAAARDAEDRAEILAGTRGLMATPPADTTTNTVLVTHNFNIEETTGLIVDEGEAVIVRPEGDGAFTVLGRVKADEWERLSP